MVTKHCFLKTSGLAIMVWMLILITAASARAQISFTEEEKDYLAQTGAVKAVSLYGAAPIQYLDSQGNIKGISQKVLQTITGLTGLQFQFSLHGSIEEALQTNPQLAVGLSPNYAGPDLELSTPYLKTETILFVNSAVDTGQLQDKTYAALKGSPLPAGIKEEHAIYYDTREEALDAVNTAKADYGYGNAYSVAFYSLQNNYKNIITIPQGKEIREYSIGFLQDDEILKAVINKAIAAIGEQRMQSIILDMTSQIERKITLPMVMETYGPQIIISVLFVIAALTVSVILIFQSNKKLQIQNQRYEVLSEISNEYLYEYYAATDEFKLSAKLQRLLAHKDSLAAIKEKFKTAFGPVPEQNALRFELQLPLRDGTKGIFKSINSQIYERGQKPHSIIGKLIDMSEEAEEKEKLLEKSQKDGLTGLYNAVTTAELVEEKLKTQVEEQKDALILIDLDGLKQINDTYGHLTGNQVLKKISESLQLTFQKTAILGRVGGDEFCIYLENVPGAHFVKTKCVDLNATFQGLCREIPASTSTGIILVQKPSTFEAEFAKADQALYTAKEKGPGNIVVYPGM